MRPPKDSAQVLTLPRRLHIHGRRRSGRRLLYLAAALMLVVLAGCGSSPETRPGNPADYRRIEALTDCSALQRELEQAQANYQRELKAGPDREAYRTITRSYLTTVETTMKRMDCK